VRRANDGRVLVYCHACGKEKTSAIVAAVRLTTADLCPPSARRGALKRAAPKPTAPKIYETVAEAARVIARKVGGNHAGSWTYYGAHGRRAFSVLRFNLPDGGKTYRPIYANRSGWSIGNPPGPLPLYDLAELAGSKCIYVCEGEKCADAAAHIGLTATTSAHGAKAASKSDWTPLAGRDVVILPDNDPAGRRYAADVAAILSRLTPPARVRIVNLPDLPEGGDIVDFLDAHEAKDPEDLRREIEALADAAPEFDPQEASEATVVKKSRPFPLGALPGACRGYVREGADALGVDPSYIALPLLGGLAGAIGNTRRVALNRTWTAPAILWPVIVGEPGSLKSPSLNFALAPALKREGQAVTAFERAMRKYQSDLKEHLASARNPSRRGREEGRHVPVEPTPPTLERLVASDTTVEALADLLHDNPRGLLLFRDELSGWLASFDQYRKGRGADLAHWRSMFDAGILIVDRKTGDRRTIFIPHAAVSVTGGIQPGILRRMLTPEYQESGLAARLLMTMPARRPKKWTGREVSESAKRDLEGVYNRLLALTLVRAKGGEQQPFDLHLSHEAKPLWVQFVNEHGKEALDFTGALAAAWSKLEGYAARLALVIELASWAENPRGREGGPAEVSAWSIRAGIEIVMWAKHETQRIYAMLSEDDEADQTRLVIELIERRGGRISARELHKAMRARFPTSDEADVFLRELVPTYGQWVDVLSGPKGGRPTRYFRLHDAPTDPPGSANKTQNRGKP
jgi:hypothetical protein